MGKHCKATDFDFDQFFETQAEARAAKRIVRLVMEWRNNPKTRTSPFLCAVWLEASKHPGCTSGGGEN